MARCCCCLSLRGGSILAVVYSIIISIVAILWYALLEQEANSAIEKIKPNFSSDNIAPALQLLKGAAFHPDAQSPRPEQPFRPRLLLPATYQGNAGLIIANSGQQQEPGPEPFSFGKILNKMGTGVKIVFGVSCSFYGFWMASGFVLLCGLKCNRPVLVLPWLFCTMFLVVVHALALIHVILFFATNFLPRLLASGMIFLEAIILALNVYSCWCVWAYYMEQTDAAKYLEEECKVPLTQVSAYTDEDPELGPFKGKE